MQRHPSSSCAARQAPSPTRRERGVRAVVALTAATMVLEIGAGYVTGSMALLADGWHMATHVAALGLASVAYTLSRRFAGHRGFAFGTGKVHALAGYTSALFLGAVALSMLVESSSRMIAPQEIDYARSLPVAVLGLIVNLLSVYLLHPGEPDARPSGEHTGHGHAHGHAHGHHDHNHRAALTHVIADSLTSALAISALLAGRYLGWAWLDPVSGIVGGLVICKWSVDLCRTTGAELLDFDPSGLDERIRLALESMDDVHVTDLHVWCMGHGARSCIVTIATATPRDTAAYHQRLAPFGLAHLTVEVQRRTPVPLRAPLPTQEPLAT